ncbi:MAG: 30S ribosomal protein S18 [Planctomycetota bacterium]
MAKISATARKRRRRRRKSRFRESAKCRFCRTRANEVDYKDVETLSKLATQQGKIFSRKRSGNCATHQRACKRAIKQARYMALMPYVG